MDYKTESLILHMRAVFPSIYLFFDLPSCHTGKESAPGGIYQMVKQESNLFPCSIYQVVKLKQQKKRSTPNIIINLLWSICTSGVRL